MIDGTRDECSAACATFPFDAIPKRTFLDTNIIDCLVKWGDCVFDGVGIPTDLPARLASDIACLRDVFLTGSRAQWDIVVSERNIRELSNTNDDQLRKRLVEYGSALLSYATANGTSEEDRRFGRAFARRARDSSFFAPLPDSEDRALLAEAVALGCDSFCTRDLKSIHKRRHLVRQVPLRIITPDEWWEHIKPWAGLWY